MKNWRTILALSLGAVFLLTLPVAVKGSFSQKNSLGQQPKQLKFVAHQVIVKFKPNRIDLKTKRGVQQATVFAESRKIETFELSKISNIVFLQDKYRSTEALINELKKDPNVEYVEPNFIQYLQTTPNDTEFSKLWGLNNTGQTVNGVAGTTDADIDAPEAWDVSTGSTAVTVAVLDSGVGTSHPDLVSNLVAGYDFVNSDSVPEDQNGHGTHVAGTISAVGNNAAGVTGVNWNVKIMPLKVADANGSINGANFILGLNYAVSNGIKIVNYSAGGTGYSQAQYDAVANAKNNGVLLMAAAGNGGNDGVGDNNDGGVHNYPSDFDLDNIISVAATDQNDALASFSNFGTTSVDVAAPGVNIYSTGFTQELFAGATLPTFTGTKFTKTSGSWLTSTWVGGDKNALANSSYTNNDDGILTLTSPVDTTAISGNVQLSFYLLADIELEASCLNDYLSVEVDNNDNNWVEKERWCNDSFGSWSETVTADLGAGTSSMRVRFKWHTNSSVTGTQVPAIDYVEISNTNDYQYKDGTSMATPHVTGLAALLKSYKSTFTYLGIKNTILNNVDAKAGLAGKILTGGRINAFTSISNVDSVAPTATVSYSTAAATNQNVTATLVPSETIVVTNNSASAAYAFTANGSFDFTFTDLAGNAGTATATVSNIDKTAPVVTVASYTTTPTNQDIIVTATTNEGTLNAASHTFTANGTFDFVATDVAGNTATSTVTIANIDKTAPVITIAPYTTTATRLDIIVTATTNEGALNAASHTFTANGTFDFVATDAAGNVTTTTVTITNIDKSAPIIKTITLTKGVYSYKLNGKTMTIRPFGTDYSGIVWARSFNFGPDGVVFVFLNSGAYKKGQIKIFKVDGKLLKAYNPYGVFATDGLNATAVVESNKNVYLAVGATKAGTMVKTYQVTTTGLKTLTSLVATAKRGNVLVSFQKLYKGQSGLVTKKFGDNTTLKVWKLDLKTNKFVEDKKINKAKIKI